MWGGTAPVDGNAPATPFPIGATPLPIGAPPPACKPLPAQGQPIFFLYNIAILNYKYFAKHSEKYLYRF
jgi:hypothetical protein